MQIHQGLSSLSRGTAGSVLSIGNFDGVHRGHSRILSTVIASARALGATPAVLTFDPHPAALLKPQRCPKWIVPVERRLELLAELGIERVCVIGSDPDFFGLSADEFVEQVVVERFGARIVVEGPDFHFGRNRAGTPQRLTELGKRFGFGVELIPPQPCPLPEFESRPISSTLIRTLIGEGRVRDAAVLLGRPVELTGPVMRGSARGRTLGFPTANLDVGPQILPAPGVYAARARLLEGSAPAAGRLAAVSIGSPPTFAGEPAKVEAFILDFDGDLYGKPVRLELLERLRGLAVFASVEDLKAQIADDVRRVRESVAGWKPAI